jgi:hypothetical protein
MAPQQFGDSRPLGVSCDKLPTHSPRRDKGRRLAQGAQFGLEDVEVVTATVDLDDVVSYRGAIASLREQASTVERWGRPESPL